MDTSIRGAESAARHLQLIAPVHSHDGVAKENSFRTIPLIKEKRLADLQDIDGRDAMEHQVDMTVALPPGSAIPIRAMTTIPTFIAIPAATTPPQSHFNPSLATLNNCDCSCAERPAGKWSFITSAGYR